MKTRNLIILLNLLLLLGYINWSVMSKEKTLAEGKLVLLELAPVDPRSLMQGDYMRLNYAISSDIKIDEIPKRGFCVVKLDKNNVAHRVRLQSKKTPLNAGEYLINYTAANWNINIGAESYFFEEGKADKFDSAEYGALKIDNEGHSLLIGLYDKNFRWIRP